MRRGLVSLALFASFAASAGELKLQDSGPLSDGGAAGLGGGGDATRGTADTTAAVAGGRPAAPSVTSGLAALEGADAGPTTSDAPQAPPPSDADLHESFAARFDALEAAQDDAAAERARLDTRVTRLEKQPLRLSATLDVGFFGVQGDGSGVRQDFARQVPGTSDIPAPWVLMGDPLSTAINFRNEPADLGASRALRDDTLHSGGRPTFLVNAVTLQLLGTLDDSLQALVVADLVPRDLDPSVPAGQGGGSWLDLKLAELRFSTRALDDMPLRVYAGRIESLLGVEYRRQESADRLGVTPSLLCRYTCGRPVGLAVRASTGDELFEFAASLTNGSLQQDRFAFFNQTDFNRFKTVAGRLAVRPKLGKAAELSVSGALGPQDRQPDDAVLQWHLGVAALLEAGDFVGTAEFVVGEAQGKADTSTDTPVPCGAAACLSYRGAYGQVGWRALPGLTPYARVDWRHARHRNGVDFAYASDVLRVTAGVRLEPHHHVILKAEVTHVHELGPFDFPDDVFTSALVVPF